MLRNYQLSHKPVLTFKNIQMYSCYLMAVKQREIKFLIWFQDLNDIYKSIWLSWVTISLYIHPLKTWHFLRIIINHVFSQDAHVFQSIS